MPRQRDATWCPLNVLQYLPWRPYSGCCLLLQLPSIVRYFSCLNVSGPRQVLQWKRWKWKLPSHVEEFWHDNQPSTNESTNGRIWGFTGQLDFLNYAYMQGFGSGVFAWIRNRFSNFSESGSGIQISLDPDPVSAPGSRSKKRVQKRGEENLNIMTKDRQKMKNATISYVKSA